MLDRKGEPQRYDNWLHQLGRLVAVGDFAQAIAHAKKMRSKVEEPVPLVPVFEFVALIAANQMEAAQLLLPELAQWRNDFGERVFAMIEGQLVPAEFDKRVIDGSLDMYAYGLLATDQIDEGLSFLERSIEQSYETADRHWISFRFSGRAEHR